MVAGLRERPTRRSGPSPASLVGLGVVALLPSLFATVLRAVPPRDDATALLASFVSYAVVGYAVALAAFLAAYVSTRRRGAAMLALLSALLLACHLSWLAPFFVADDRPAASPTFTLLSLNLHQGGADLDQLVQRARSVDVVVLLEVTGPARTGLRQRGWDELFPYAAEQGLEVGTEAAVYSRYPLTDSHLVEESTFQQWVTDVAVPDVGSVRLLAVHPCNPYCGHGRWTREHDALTRLAAQNLDRPLVLAGDFNAVDDHAPLQDLARLGLVSATDLVGAGWLPTYPSDRWFPPLLPIDHVLVDDQMTATSLRTFRVSRTDHLGLLTTLASSGR